MSSPALPFKVLGVLSIIAAGLIAAMIAYAPTQPMVWMVAYLVLVAGVVQYVLGAGLAVLPARPPSTAVAACQCLLLNLGHAGVVGGTLSAIPGVLMAGTVCYDLAALWLGWTVRGGPASARRLGYWALVAAMVISSFVGLGISSLGS